MIKPARWMVVPLITLTICACAENNLGHSGSPDVVVGEIKRDLRWGDREAVFEVTNPTDFLKFLTVEVEVQFEGDYLTPNRRTRSHVILPPAMTEPVKAKVYIPGNYGTAKGRITVYDVVDTLDAILPGQKCFEDNFMITFHPPESVLPYLQTDVTLPPRVDEHPDFDHQLARLMLILLHEGRSVPQIAEMTAADTVYVQEEFDGLVEKGYVKVVDGLAKLKFPLISVEEAQRAKLLAERLSDSLVATITENLPEYRRTLEGMAVRGLIPKDSNSFLDGGTVLYYPYPVVSSMLLWWDLGQRFITRSAPLLIYDGTDVCNAQIPYYMYAVLGGPYFNGTCFYSLTMNPRHLSIEFGDSLPKIECPENFMLYAKQPAKSNYTMARENRQETFTIDTSVIRPALEVLAGDIDSVMVRTYYELKSLSQDYGREKASYGMRYWFWNLTASRTLVKLVKQGVLERRGNGQYRFQSYTRAGSKK